MASQVHDSRADEDAGRLVQLGISQGRTLGALREAAAGCRACPLWRLGTQTVFGEGPDDARVVMVGEQPGDREDQAGRPFVGPAGRLLDRALEEAGIDRRAVYVTNAVKHFKWIAGGARGKRRIHQKPSATEVSACNPWLRAEIELAAPEVIVCLGATAAQALLGRAFKVTQHRGEMASFGDGAPGTKITATVHPSSILRARDDETRERDFASLVRDLKVVARLLARH